MEYKGTLTLSLIKTDMKLIESKLKASRSIRCNSILNKFYTDLKTVVFLSKIQFLMIYCQSLQDGPFKKFKSFLRNT